MEKTYILPIGHPLQVETPLHTAKQLIKLSAEKYDTPYSFEKFVSNNQPTTFLLYLFSPFARWKKRA